MIEVATAAGANAVKIQTFKAEEFVGDSKQPYTYRSQGKKITESMLSMLERYELLGISCFLLRKNVITWELCFYPHHKIKQI